MTRQDQLDNSPYKPVQHVSNSRSKEETEEFKVKADYYRHNYTKRLEK